MVINSKGQVDLSSKVAYFELVQKKSNIFFSEGDRELIISTYPMSQKLTVAPRLLFSNACF